MTVKQRIPVLSSRLARGQPEDWGDEEWVVLMGAMTTAAQRSRRTGQRRSTGPVLPVSVGPRTGGMT
ncbi:protein of unknown function [Blastococcus saxobsidens DD2]|uniref:Uncharacterized protein n=1 Tax=Blastococcus saxobsidens (strain DD2) TaxID=1146883 RepID=H6RWH3_BLASD|nr:protein of unknown function [Blastococcus saxobsidens DD2]